MSNLRTLIPRIFCAKCRKPVECTEWWEDYKSGDRAIRVYCHGATQEMRIDLMKLHPDTLHALEGAQGLAFEEPVLIAGEKT